MKTPPDTFSELARYYDPLMAHVDYERWFLITTALADLLPEEFRHLDACCGTGTLLEKLHEIGWKSVGVDLSADMLCAGRMKRETHSLAVADIRALPFKGSIDYITCLFDSINFLLEEDSVRQAFKGFSDALTEDGVLYFDIVTERMVTKHFEGQTWQEDNGTFTSVWSSSFDRATAISETEIRLRGGPVSTLRERIYSQSFIEEALSDAGLTLLGAYEAGHWKRVRRGTTRIDFVAMKGSSVGREKRFKAVRKNIRLLLS